MAERVAKNVDPAAVEVMRRAEAARRNAERSDFLYGRLFGNVQPNRDVASLRTEDQAREMFRLALENANNLLQVEILRVAVDKRWPSIVTAFIKVWDGEHPIADTVRELWNLTLTTGRSAV